MARCLLAVRTDCGRNRKRLSLPLKKNLPIGCFTTTTAPTSVPAPVRGSRAALTADSFAAAVDESADAGVDAHFFQPGLCWVPWWPSKVLPLEEYVRWFKERFDPQAKPDAFLKFVLDGGDPVKITLDRCRERGIGAFISFRLNDAHNKSAGVDPDNPKTARMYCTPRFYSEHPEYRFGDETPKDWPSYAKYL